jgi:hypothetical protein
VSNFFTKHFGAIAFGAAINIPSLVKGAVWLTDWLSRFDYWNTHARDIPGISVMTSFLTDPPPWTVFITSAAAVAVILWDVRRQNRQESAPVYDPNRRLLIGFYVFCAAIAIGVWSTWWFVCSPAQAAVATPAPTSAPNASPKPAPSPPKPKPPWLSPEEMALQLSKGHPLLIYSPQELFDMLQSGQNLNVFLDRWVKVAGPTSSLPTQEKIQKQDFYRIELKLDVSRYFIQGKIAAYFDPKKYGEVLLSTRLGGDLQAACQLSKIEPSKPYPNGSFYADVTLYTFDYYNCEPL